MSLSSRGAVGASLLLAQLAAQSTWIVDRQGGAGSHFTAIQPAVDAAASGDTIVVRTAAYDERVLVQGKALNLVGIDAAIVSAASFTEPLLEIRAVPAGQRGSVRGFTFTHISGAPGDALRLADNRGSLWLENLFIDNYDGVALRISRCDEVVLRAVTTQSLAATPDARGNEVPSAGVDIESSRVWLHDGRTLGSSRGSRVPHTGVVAGGDGIAVRDATVTIHSVDCIGGHGESLVVGTCRQGAIGGAGLRVAGASQVQERGNRFFAGTTGVFDAGCASNPGTALPVVAAPGTLTSSAAAPRLLRLPAMPFAHGAFEVALVGAANDSYVVLLSASATTATPWPGVDGALFLPPAAVIPAWSGRLGANGRAAFAANFGVGHGAAHVYGQAGFLDGSAQLWLSNPAGMTLR